MLKKLKKVASQTVGRDDSPPNILDSEYFELTKTVIHGIPSKPSTLAYDPVQSLLAVGTEEGIVSIFGTHSVERNFRHEDCKPLIQLLFVHNEGILISVTVDSVNLWDLKSSEIVMLHRLQFSENICFCHIPCSSHWMYVGSTRGNIHLVNIDNFQLSEYLIYWNHTLEVSEKTHPGAVIGIDECPNNDQHLLIGYEKGNLVLWDVKDRKVLKRFGTKLKTPRPLTSFCWFSDGKQFITSHTSGPMMVWNVKTPDTPENIIHPMADLEESAPRLTPIGKVLWASAKDGDFLIHSGGTFQDAEMDNVSIKHKNVSKELFFLNEVVDFLTINESPWPNDIRNPRALVILLSNELVVCDLTCAGTPSFRSPFGLAAQSSEISVLEYFTDVSASLLAGLKHFGKSSDSATFSKNVWPIFGGIPGEEGDLTTNDLVISGHEDGSVKFWDASTIDLELLCVFSCTACIRKCQLPFPDNVGVEKIAFCPVSRFLTIGLHSGEVLVCVFSPQEREVCVRTCTVEVTPLKDKFSGQSLKDALTNELTVDITEKESFVPPKDKLQKLMRLGYNLEWCHYALQKFNCDMNLSAAFLFDQGIPIGDSGGDLPPNLSELRSVTSKDDALIHPEAQDAPAVTSPSALRRRCFQPEIVVDFGFGIQPVCVCHNVQKNTTIPMGPLTAVSLCSLWNLLVYSDQHVVVFVDVSRAFVLSAGPLAAFEGTVEPHQSGDSRRLSMGNLTIDDFTTSIAVGLFVLEESKSPEPCVVLSSSKGGIFFYRLVLNSTANVISVASVVGVYFFYDRGINLESRGVFFVDSSGLPIASPHLEWSEHSPPLGANVPNSGSRKSSFLSKSTDLCAPTDPGDSTAAVRENEEASCGGRKEEEKKCKHGSQFLVAVSKSRARVFAFPSKNFKYEKVDMHEDSWVVSSRLLLLYGETCLAVLTTDGRVRIYSLPDLNVLMDAKVGMRLTRASISNDGRLVTATNHNQITRFSLLANENILNLPTCLATLYNADITVPMRPAILTPTGFFKSVLNAVTVGSANAGDHSRDELFQSAKSGSTLVAKRIETKAEREEHARRMDQVSATGSAFAETGRQLNERTDKLDTMQDTTERMRDEAKQFSGNARALREKMERKNKSWWHF